MFLPPSDESLSCSPFVSVEFLFIASRFSRLLEGTAVGPRFGSRFSASEVWEDGSPDLHLASEMLFRL